jgi:hypothetical protein
LLLTGAEDDCHKGDDTFGQRGSERGENRSDGHRPDFQSLAQPLHGVDEPLAGEVDHRCTGDE